ncbi:hypothetical protein [Brunnivagina elsteri]|uniref:hypothetical protein n=1 Tax=Brunnivagina elsteri TaxID=1247191 RepID=UPI0013046A4B|nr:hypothetical protein [Calothrix elsteri]
MRSLSVGCAIRFLEMQSRFGFLGSAIGFLVRCDMPLALSFAYRFWFVGIVRLRCY